MSEPAPQAGDRVTFAPAHANGSAPVAANDHRNGASVDGSNVTNGTHGANGANGSSPSSLRHAILVHLRQTGPTSPDGLAAALGASRTGVLQQLHALEEAGLVRHAPMKHGVGRPRHLYDITADAQELFPADYQGLAVGLLSAIEAVGGADLIEQVFAARRQQVGVRLHRAMAERLPADAPLADRVRELARLQDDAGYLAESTEVDGTLRLREHNCAIHRLVASVPAACDAELQLFREILRADVVRETHIATGDRCCSYRIAESVE